MLSRCSEETSEQPGKVLKVTQTEVVPVSDPHSCLRWRSYQDADGLPKSRTNSQTKRTELV